ncbi:hypothetical protein B9Z55_020768 [Caenorhabditis nigoni]|nr:hypothetical protein B9Z55_020768 [Caenorhabditis nigoni]
MKNVQAAGRHLKNKTCKGRSNETTRNVFLYHKAPDGIWQQGAEKSKKQEAPRNDIQDDTVEGTLVLEKDENPLDTENLNASLYWDNWGLEPDDIPPIYSVSDTLQTLEMASIEASEGSPIHSPIESTSINSGQRAFNQEVQLIMLIDKKRRHLNVNFTVLAGKQPEVEITEVRVKGQNMWGEEFEPGSSEC